MKRAIKIIPAAVALALGVAANAYAHTPSHQASCAGITASGQRYTEGGTVELAIGTAHAQHTFTDPTWSYTLANPDKTRPEPWSIVIVSNAKDGSATYEGTINACDTAPGTTPPTSTTTTTTSPSTTSPPSPTTLPTTTSTTTFIVAPSTSSTPTTTIPATSTSSSVPAGSSSTTPTTRPSAVRSTSTILSAPSPASPTTPSQLPATGRDESALLYGGGLFVGVGATAWCLTRRTRFGVKR